jgi:hypothetical protein
VGRGAQALLVLLTMKQVKLVRLGSPKCTIARACGSLLITELTLQGSPRGTHECLGH